MKPNLYFLVNWMPGNKERSWSGTNWGLYKALQKYFEVKDIDLHRPDTFKQRVMRRLWYDEKRNFGISKILANRKKVLPMLNRMYNNTKINVFEFGEIIPDSPNTQTYIYQDLGVPYIEYMQKYLPDDYAVSTYEDIPLKRVRQRAQMQMEYYMTCSGIFTMGKWLKDYFVKECRIPEFKIYSVGGV